MPFITNSDSKNLEQRLRYIIPKSVEINILVGFFYFSSVPFLYEILRDMDDRGKLRKGHIKILVGLDVDQRINKLYEYALETPDPRNQFFLSLDKAFTSGDMDNQEIYEQVEFFLKLLREEKLLLRKTRKPNHAKLYLFILEEEQAIPHLFITGSSNLTKSGLSYQEEFNVEIRDYGFDEAKAYFDRLWKDSMPLDVNKILEHLRTKTFLRAITPFEGYVYALKTYMDTYTDNSESSKSTVKTLLEESGYNPYTYQVEAIAQAVRIVNTHGGVILADVVGLGKSVIAVAVAKRLGTRGIVIAPPHLIGDDGETYGWKKYLADFKLHDWKVFSVGKLKDALEYVERHQDIQTVIVDEAHRFRNENTKSYAYLQQICSGKKVLLLSATPFNNRPSDIFAMLKLFTIPKKSTIVFDEDLEYKFEEFERTFKKLSYIKTYWNSSNINNRERAKRYYSEIFKEKNIDINKVNNTARNLAKQIRNIIEPVVIRRNRLDLRYYRDKIDLPEVKDPIEKFFELTQEQLSFYDEVISAFTELSEGGKFTGAIYFPERYKRKEKEEDGEDFAYIYQKNLYSFMRRLLVKRFESSFGAFKNSLERFLEIHKNVLNFIDRTKRFVLDRDIVEEILFTEDDEAIEQKLQELEEQYKQNKESKYHEVYKIEELGEDFVKDIQRDIELFKELLQKFEEAGLEKSDPKARKLLETIEEFLNDRKVVVFTEYLDTAKYLRKILEGVFENKVLCAFGNLTRHTIESIYKNFDASAQEQSDEYTILLATDKLSEGFNLNRAGVVINYDIPWNPVRVIQRVGRINRIGKKVYNELYIVNFFPTEIGADIVRSREIAQNKMFMIHKVLGEDAKIFSPEEEPQPSELYRRINTYTEGEPESFYSKIRKEFEEIKQKYPEVLKNIENLPQRVKTAKNHNQDNLIVLIRKGTDLFVGYKDPESEAKIVSFNEVYEHLKADYDTKPLPLSENFWKNYNDILNYNTIKNLKDAFHNSQRQARNVLKSILKHYQLSDELREYVQDLLNNIEEFGSIPKYIVNRIRNLRLDKNLPKELYELKEEYPNPKVEPRTWLYKDSLEPIYILAVENRRIS